MPSNRGRSRTRHRSRLPPSFSYQHQRFPNLRLPDSPAPFIVGEAEDGSGVDLFPSRYKHFFDNNTGKNEGEEESESSTTEGGVRDSIHSHDDNLNSDSTGNQESHQERPRDHYSNEEGQEDQSSSSSPSSSSEVNEYDNNNNKDHHQENNNDPDQGLTEEQIQINKEVVIPLFESILSQADDTSGEKRLKVFLPSSPASSLSNNNRHISRHHYRPQDLHNNNPDYHSMPSSSLLSLSSSTSSSSPFFTSHAIRSVTSSSRQLVA